MSTTDFLDVLGVPEHADARAIKRAYAALLKRIDPAADPDGFARLRRSYEQALDHASKLPEKAAQQDDDQAETRSGDVRPIVIDERATDEHPPVDVAPPDPLTHTLQLADAFAVAAQRTPVGELAGLLARTVSGLRLGYIDAPGRFEERVIDLLMEARIGHRVAIFTALGHAFHWNEIGHLAPLGARGAWIERVVAQELAWREVQARARQSIVDRLDQAEASRTIPMALVREWPRVATALAEFPDYLALHLAIEKQTAWREAFEALDREPVPQSPSQFHRRDRDVSGAVGGVGTVAVVLFVLARMFSQAPMPAMFRQEGPTVDATVVDRERLARCTSLYVEMDRPGALEHVGEERAGRMRGEAERCLDLGFWHRPAPQSRTP
jgi:hypothetical protein